VATGVAISHAMTPVVVITGAGSGIGCVVALGLARAGYALALADGRGEPLREVAREIGS
jgi:NADP-dependent 3-hydroxy acid dehydrogenase YdfG